MVKSANKQKKSEKNAEQSDQKNSPKKQKEIKKEVKKEKKDNKILEVKTTQTAAFKQVIERISGVISDCCIVFIPPDENQQSSVDEDYYEEVSDNEEESESTKKKNISKKKTSKGADSDDEDTDKKSSKKKKADKNDSKAKPSAKNSKKNTGGIRILRLTEDKSILIKLNLEAANFEYFRCDEPKITIGVDMHNLQALLKMIDDNYPIILYMNRDNRSTLYIRSLNENDKSSEETDIEIFLMDIANPEMPIPQTEFQNKITIATDKFHNICKHLNNNSVYVDIKSINNEILFKGQNEGGKVTMSYKDINENGSKKKDKPDQVVQGLYELRNLMGFSKCNKLCNTIDIYLKNDFPLVLVISVATLGKMYVFLSPIENPNQ